MELAKQECNIMNEYRITIPHLYSGCQGAFNSREREGHYIMAVDPDQARALFRIQCHKDGREGLIRHHSGNYYTLDVELWKEVI